MRVESRLPPASAEPSRRAEPPTQPGRFRALVGGRTPLDPPAAAAQLEKAWRDVLGQPPPPRAIAILWAQWALETGRGQSMHGHNFGGLKGRAPDGGSSVLATREGHGASEQTIRSRFRAYASPEAGARDYVATLAEKYPRALAGAVAGSPETFVRELERARYFTGDPSAYRRGIAALVHEYETRGPAAPRLPSVQAPGPALDALLWTIARQTSKKGT